MPPKGMASLALMCSHVGRPGAGLMPIRGHSGVQGGAEMGAYATVFPGRPIGERGADELEQLWGFRPPAEVGLDTVAMLEAAGCGIAMANAVDQAKAAADRHTLSNQEDGVAHAIEMLLSGAW